MKALRGLFLLILIAINLESIGQGEMLENADFDNIIQSILPQQENDDDYNDLYDRLFTL